MQNKNRVSKSRSWFANTIKSTDMFGSEVHFRYKNQMVFKSFIGGTFSILLAIGILVYFIIEVTSVMAKNNYTITNSIVKRNLNTDMTEITMNSSNFYVAISPTYQGSALPPGFSTLDQFFSLTFYQAQFKWNITENSTSYDIQEEDFEIGTCNSDRIFKAIGSSFANIDGYICLNENFTFSLQGTFTATQSKYFGIKLRYCEQSTLDAKYPGQNLKCATKNQTNSIIPYIQVNLPLSTSYVDATEFDQDKVIKSTTKPFFFRLNQYTSEAYTFKISQNYLVMRDSVLSNYYNMKNISYLETNIDYSQVGSLESGFNSIIEFLFVIDENTQTTERSISTLSNALSAVGGMLGFLQPLIRNCLTTIQQALFTNELLRKIFLVNSKVTEKSQSKQNQKKKPSKKSAFDKKDKTQKKEAHGPKNKSDIKEERYKQNQEDKPNFDLENVNHNLDTNFDSDHFIKYYKQLKSFKMTIIELVQFKFRTLFFTLCKKKPNDKIYLFKNGVRQLEENLDIVQLIKSVRKFDIVSQLLLTKYQYSLLTMTNNHVLEPKRQQQKDEGEVQDKKKSLDDEDMVKLLQKLLKSCDKNKVSKKLLKRLNINQRQIENLIDNQREVASFPLTRKNLLKKNNPGFNSPGREQSQISKSK